MVPHACYPSIGRWRQQDQEFKETQLHSIFGASVSYASKNDQTSRVSSNNSPCDKLQSSLSQNPSPSPDTRSKATFTARSTVHDTLEMAESY